MKYRKEIDGLRALAILPVILYHAGFGWISGGYLGVDVFFVISGYLITNIIYKEIQLGEFSLWVFYERRIRRILPALYFVILVTFGLAWFWMLPDHFKNFSKSVMAINLFSSNIVFWKDTGYFTQGAELAPLLHTWSLAIEEQFYLLFPVLLILCRKLRRSYLIIIMLILIISSVLLSSWAAIHAPVANFYLLPTRGWELAIGSIIALNFSPLTLSNKLLKNALAFAGLFMICGAYLVFDQNSPTPSYMTLIPTVGAALILLYAQSSTIVGTALSHPILVWFGLISYSAYLWHWPIFVFGRIISVNEPSNFWFLFLGLISIFMAFLSWKFVEKPFRDKTKFKSKTIFGLAIISTLIIFAFGFFGYKYNGFPSRIDPQILKITRSPDDLDSRLKGCEADAGAPIEPRNSCIYGNASYPTVAVLGDSHANFITAQLSDAISHHNISLRNFSHSGCMPIKGIHFKDKSTACAEHNQRVRAFVEDEPNLDMLVLSARWTFRLEHTRFDNKDGGIEYGEESNTLPNSPDEMGLLINSTVSDYLNMGKKIILVYPIPEVGWEVPFTLAKKLKIDINDNSIITRHSVFTERNSRTYEQLDKIEFHPNILRIYPEHVFCNQQIKDKCIATLNGVPLYFDDDHLNIIGAKMLGEHIEKKLLEKGWVEYTQHNDSNIIKD